MISHIKMFVCLLFSDDNQLTGTLSMQLRFLKDLENLGIGALESSVPSCYFLFVWMLVKMCSLTPNLVGNIFGQRETTVYQGVSIPCFVTKPNPFLLFKPNFPILMFWKCHAMWSVIVVLHVANIKSIKTYAPQSGCLYAFVETHSGRMI